VRGLVFALLMTTQAVAAAPRLSQSQVRAFVERQSRAWNAGDLAAYFATFSPEARFTDQALSNENKVVPYGVSTLAQARAQTRKTLAKSKIRETSAVSAVTIAPDGRSARVTAHTVSDIATAGAARRICAVRVETVALTPAGLKSTGQTDTIVRCRAGAIR
jgi:3-phenylpropionate/cinnamic acid dioxygenase small subunit